MTRRTRAREKILPLDGRQLKKTRGRLEELAMHPTVKPTALVADAIKDCSRRGGLVLDPFCGSGTILVRAHRPQSASSRD
jgi:DNA modification methylase